jgi:hypothetical protein
MTIAKPEVMKAVPAVDKIWPKELTQQLPVGLS